MNNLSASDQAARAFLGRLAQQVTSAESERSIERQIMAGTQEAIRWGRIDRRTQHFQPKALSADAAIYESQDLMNRRVRSEKFNNAQVKHIIDALVDLVVGCGLQTFADPFDPLLDLSTLTPEDLDDHLRYALESDERYEGWFQEEKYFDVGGKLNGPAMHRLAMSECAETGDAIIVRSQRKRRGTPITLCYQIIEREQLDLSKDRPAGPDQNKIINGIEIDKYGQEVAFHIYDAHPFDDFSGANTAGESSRVTADRVIHLYMFQRPSQNIGMNWLHAIGQNNFDRDKFLGSEIQTAAKAAMLLLVAHFKNLHAGSLGIGDGEDDTDEHGNPELKLGNSTHAIAVGLDDKVKLIESARPNDRLEPFMKVLDHDTAGGAGLSYYTLTGRYDETNFGSIRAAKLDEDLHIRPIQQWHAGRLALPIRRDFNRQAVAAGIIQSISPGEFLANPQRYERFDAMGPGREYLDPEAEYGAAAGRCRSAFSTLKIECGRRGLHWIRVLRQIALENRVADLLKVVIDFSKGQGGQVEESTRSGDKTSTKKKAGAK